jgi:GT2 family glycosyltransferase
MTEICAVIVTWNSTEHIGDCLRSLEPDHDTGLVSVVVVDNASSDGTVELVRTVAPWAQVIANSTNRGLAAGNNQGLLAATGEFVLISNPDVVYAPGAVAALKRLLDDRSDAAVAVARLMHSDGRVQVSAGDLPTLGEALWGRSLRPRGGSRDNECVGWWWDNWAHDEARPIGHGAEAAYLVRRAAIADVGGQDERFWLDWEGFDWSARFHAAGWTIWFCPEAEVVHAGGASIRRARFRWVVSTHRGMYRYFAARVWFGFRPVLAAAISARAAVKAAALLSGVDLYAKSRQPDTGS